MTLLHNLISSLAQLGSIFVLALAIYGFTQLRKK